MNYHDYQKTGAYHLAAGIPCQDAVLAMEDSEYAMIALADGVSACQFGKTGAETAVKALWDYIQLERENVFLYAPQKLSYLLLEHVLYYLELASVSETADIKEFSSTLAFACMEKKTGRTVAGNLGDGGILGAVQSQFERLSVPKGQRDQPFVTTSKFANKAMMIRYDALSLGDCILLGSDGFLHALRAIANRGIQISEVLENFAFSELDRYLEEYPEPDDCTYAAMQYSREKAERKSIWEKISAFP